MRKVFWLSVMTLICVACPTPLHAASDESTQTPPTLSEAKHTKEIVHILPGSAQTTIDHRNALLTLIQNQSGIKNSSGIDPKKLL